jgi:hypothetical protein
MCRHGLTGAGCFLLRKRAPRYPTGLRPRHPVVRKGENPHGPEKKPVPATAERLPMTGEPARRDQMRAIGIVSNSYNGVKNNLGTQAILELFEEVLGAAQDRIQPE